MGNVLIDDKAPLISIVVPVYKAEMFLTRCVESVLHQTYTNWELILVDDGSPDRCGAMCDAYARRDARILVIHQKEQGGFRGKKSWNEKLPREVPLFFGLG